MNIRQHGISLIEVLGAMALGSMLLVGVTRMVDDSLEDSKGQQASFYQAQVVAAAAKYVNLNFNTLAAVATANKPAVVKISDLKNPPGGAAPFISSNFADKNAYGQDTCVLVLQPAAGRLDTMIVTSGGTPIAEKDIASVAANAGQGSGYIAPNSPLVAHGASWALSAAELAKYKATGCLDSAASDGGHLASMLFFDGPGQMSGDYVYRNKVGTRKDLNSMTTPLFLTGTAVEGQTDTACSADVQTWGGISTDPQGQVLSCQGGLWKKTAAVGSWKEPVIHFNFLPMTGNSDGDTRMATWNNRAFTWRASENRWVPVAVDDTGNLSMERRLTANDILIKRQVTLGDPCDPNGDPVGTVAIDNLSGAVLSCQEGKWASQSGLTKRNDLSQNATWVLMESSVPVGDLAPGWIKYPTNAYGSYLPRANWNYAEVETPPIVPKKESLAIVQLNATMNRQKGSNAANEPVRGQFEMQSHIIDLDTGLMAGKPTNSRSGKLDNEAVVLSTTSVQTLPQNKLGYKVVFRVAWTCFDVTNFYDRTWWTNGAGVTFEQTPLKMTYYIEVSA